MKLKKGKKALRTKNDMLMLMLVANLLAEPGTLYLWASAKDATGKSSFPTAMIIR